MKIRLMEKQDLKKAVVIVGDNYNHKYDQSAALELKDMFGKSSIKPTYYVAEDQGEVIGFAGFIQSWMDYNIWQIFWVNVAPEKQRQGVGVKLVAKIISDIKKKKGANIIQLTADKTNGNEAYYKKKFGFKTLQTFHNDTYALMSLSLEK